MGAELADGKIDDWKDAIPVTFITQGKKTTISTITHAGMPLFFAGRGAVRMKIRGRDKVDAFLADVEKPALEKAVAELAAAGAEVTGVVCDVSDWASVQAAAAATLDAFGAEDFVGGHGVHRWIHVIEVPFVGRDLAVGVHIPLAQQNKKLPLGKFRVEPRHRQHVERQVPSCEPGILDSRWSWGLLEN